MERELLADHRDWLNYWKTKRSLCSLYFLSRGLSSELSPIACDVSGPGRQGEAAVRAGHSPGGAGEV